MQENTKTNKQIKIELGNAAQKGRNEWETHARYRRGTGVWYVRGGGEGKGINCGT